MASSPAKPVANPYIAGIIADPLAAVNGIAGVRVMDVGQGDAIALLDLSLTPVLWIDYGGRESSPFKQFSGKKKIAEIDKVLPAGPGVTVMLTHWDEDHWNSAKDDTAVEGADWIVPRQFTSPRAVRRSARFQKARCVPEALVGQLQTFRALNGDALQWEKLKRFDSNATHEDCNRTGLAFSIVRAGTGEGILLPGDAPLNAVRHYARFDAKFRLRGLVAPHHGAGTHWPKTEALLRFWNAPGEVQDVVFSCGMPNSYQHPDATNYAAAIPNATQHESGHGAFDILF
jgi:beta-lactamase superfamily II metal-dependent hydrolase